MMHITKLYKLSLIISNLLTNNFISFSFETILATQCEFGFVNIVNKRKFCKCLITTII